MTHRVAAAVVVALGLVACSTPSAPTYTTAASVRLGPCPQRGVPQRGHTTIVYRVKNGSHGTWPATYLLLTLQGAAKGTLRVFDAPSEGIGGGIRRVTAPLRPDRTVSGAVSVYLARRGWGQVNVGAWGAPENSIAVPSSYPHPACRLNP